MTADKWQKFIDWANKNNKPEIMGYLTLYPHASQFLQNISANAKIELVSRKDISLTPDKLTYDGQGIRFIQKINSRHPMRGIIPYNYIKHFKILNWNLCTTKRM